MTSNQKTPAIGQQKRYYIGSGEKSVQTELLNDQQGKMVNMKQYQLLFLIKDIIENMKHMNVRIKELENNNKATPKRKIRGKRVDFTP